MGDSSSNLSPTDRQMLDKLKEQIQEKGLMEGETFAKAGEVLAEAASPKESSSTKTKTSMSTQESVKIVNGVKTITRKTIVDGWSCPAQRRPNGRRAAWEKLSTRAIMRIMKSLEMAMKTKKVIMISKKIRMQRTNYDHVFVFCHNHCDICWSLHFEFFHCALASNRDDII